ncbi:hypothetical protein ACX0G9_31030 [Flavitalea flava]
MELLKTIAAQFLDEKRYNKNMLAAFGLFLLLSYLVGRTKNWYFFGASIVLGLIALSILQNKFYRWFSKNGFIYLTTDEITVEILGKKNDAVESRDSYKWSDIGKVLADNTGAKMTARLRLYFRDGSKAWYSFANHYHEPQKASVGVDIPKFVAEYNKGKDEESIIKIGSTYFDK